MHLEEMCFGTKLQKMLNVVQFIHACSRILYELANICLYKES